MNYFARDPGGMKMFELHVKLGYLFEKIKCFCMLRLPHHN